MTTAPSPSARLGPIRRALTHLLLDGRAPAPVLSLLHRRMLADDVWRAHYHALRRVEQVAARADFGPGQADLVERMILAQLPVGARHRRLPAAGVLAFAGGAAALLLLVGLGDLTKEAWTQRGADPHSADAQSVGVRVRCLDREAHLVVGEAEAAPGLGQGGLVCPRGRLLSFSVTNRSSQEQHVFVVGLSPAGELRWYAPFLEGASSAPMAKGAVDELLSTVADTSAMPGDGRVTLHALFSKRPLSGAEVATLVRGAAARGVPVGALERLPIAGAEQGRLELLEKPPR